MNKLEEAQNILTLLHLPERQCNSMCCYTLLALANLHPEQSWTDASNSWIRIHDIIAFANFYYKTDYAENSRESFRKQALHHFRNAALIEDNGKATNSPNYRYRLTKETLQLIRNFNTPNWSIFLSIFTNKHESLISQYTTKRNMLKIPVQINGKELVFSTGKHNQLQKAIIEEFSPRFAPNSICLYVGDTIEKDMIKNEFWLHELGFSITLHDKMPDVVLYAAEKNWLYFIEAVTSVGPMNPERIHDLKAMTQDVTAGKIYVTAFLDFATYKKFAHQLAWDTEVWIAENPDHMIHLNGDRFLGPR